MHFLTRPHFQCARTLQPNLTFLRAIKSEAQFRVDVLRKLPNQYIRRALLRFTHGKRGKLDAIVDQVWLNGPAFRMFPDERGAFQDPALPNIKPYPPASSFFSLLNLILFLILRLGLP